MNRALGSNRAEYGRRRNLIMLIRMDFVTQGMSLADAVAVKLPRKVGELEEYYQRIHQQVKDAGLLRSQP
jgi:hypothetical protein